MLDPNRRLPQEASLARDFGVLGLVGFLGEGNPGGGNKGVFPIYS